MNRDQLRAARANTKSRGSAMVKAMSAAPMSAARRAKLRNAALRGAATRRAQGEVTYASLLALAEQGASLTEAMEALGLSENGVRKNLRERLGTGAWPPAI